MPPMSAWNPIEPHTMPPPISSCVCPCADAVHASSRPIATGIAERLTTMCFPLCMSEGEGDSNCVAVLATAAFTRKHTARSLGMRELLHELSGSDTLILKDM